ncbi:MAG: hypothetical protein AB4352_25665 [Hormoscilla sp.]
MTSDRVDLPQSGTIGDRSYGTVIARGGSHRWIATGEATGDSATIERYDCLRARYVGKVGTEKLKSIIDKLVENSLKHNSDRDRPL